MVLVQHASSYSVECHLDPGKQANICLQLSYYQKQKLLVFNKNSLYLEEVLGDESESL